MGSFREIAERMNPVDSETPTTLRELNSVHRFRPEDRDQRDVPSFRRLCDRHTDESGSISTLLGYNTWLLRAPLDRSKPQLTERARELGDRIRVDQIDIVALCEVFTTKEIDRIRAGLGPLDRDYQRHRGPRTVNRFRRQTRRAARRGCRIGAIFGPLGCAVGAAVGATGSFVRGVRCVSRIAARELSNELGDRGGWAGRLGGAYIGRLGGVLVGPIVLLLNAFFGSSGLIILVRDRAVENTTVESFENPGDPCLDADWYSNKGILHTEIDLGAGHIDLFTTHLFAGGDFIDDDDPERIRRIREQQVRQLRAFIEETAKPENVTVVTGDINLNFHEVPEYSVLERELGPGGLGLEDYWRVRGGQFGSTSHRSSVRAYEVCRIETVGSGSLPASSPFYCDDDVSSRGRGRTERPRIDYIWVEPPTNEHTFNLDLSRMRRRSFWRGPGFPPDQFFHENGETVPHYLSDHLGLEVVLVASSLE